MTTISPIGWERIFNLDAVWEPNVYIIVRYYSYTMVIEAKTKQWGNSIGIVIPSKIVEKLALRPEENIIVEISKKENVLKELFGAVKFKRSVKEVIKEVREDLESKWLK